MLQERLRNATYRHLYFNIWVCLVSVILPGPFQVLYTYINTTSNERKQIKLQEHPCFLWTLPNLINIWHKVNIDFLIKEYSASEQVEISTVWHFLKQNYSRPSHRNVVVAKTTGSVTDRKQTPHQSCSPLAYWRLCQKKHSSFLRVKPSSLWQRPPTQC